MSKVYIVEAKRSAIGKFLGSLSTVSAGDLAGQVIKATLNNLDIDKAKIDEVILGNVISAGQGQGVARQASIAAGIPAEVPAYAVNMICGSGMKTVMLAYNSIKAQEANLIVAGGVEVMSQIPFVTDPQARLGYKMGNITLKDILITDGLTDVFNNYHMGITAENIADEYTINRAKQDAFAIESQKRAISAIDTGKFKDEIVPVEVAVRKGSFVFDTDEYPNRSTSIEALSGLRPAFKKDGSVTAGNASGINDGAAIIVVASEAAVKEYNLKPLVEIVAVGQGGVAPEVMGLGPVPAVVNAFEKCDLTLKNMDLIELNEAFAVQALGVITGLKQNFEDVDDEWFSERTNVNGGAIALGHPLGASGARITTTLIYEMKKRGAEYGLATLCIGGGMGTALILKNA